MCAWPSEWEQRVVDKTNQATPHTPWLALIRVFNARCHLEFEAASFIKVYIHVPVAGQECRIQALVLGLSKLLP